MMIYRKYGDWLTVERPLIEVDSLLSQKARGLRDLVLKSGKFIEAGVVANVIHLDAGGGFNEKALAPPDEESTPPNIFRPCPATPQHGFVDSVVGRASEVVPVLISKILATGEPVEIIRMPFIEAVWSGILTGNTLSLGPGHDGATSGKGWTIPTICPISTYTKATLRPEDCSPGNNHPYLEFVIGYDGSCHLVQLRAGPKPPGQANYVPWKKSKIIKKVLIADNQDLLAWQQLCHKPKPGTVIYLNGKPWTSHYAIHGQTNKIPVISTFEPKVGETLAPTKEYVPTQQDLERLALCLSQASSLPTAPNTLIAEVFAIVHHLALWKSWTEAECRLTAYATIMLPRISTTLALGEMRHSKHNGVHPLLDKVRTGARSDAYAIGQAISTVATITILPYLIKGFRDYPWPSSFGGMKWSIGAEDALETLRNAANFMVTPTPELWAATKTHLNSLCYAVHNGGRFHNKIISAGEMDRIAATPGPPLMFKAWDILTLPIWGDTAFNRESRGSILLDSIPKDVTYSSRNKPPLANIPPPKAKSGGSTAAWVPPQQDLLSTQETISLVLGNKNKGRFRCIPDGSGGHYLKVQLPTANNTYTVSAPFSKKAYGIGFGVTLNEEEYKAYFVGHDLLAKVKKTTSLAQSLTVYHEIHELTVTKDLSGTWGAAVTLDTPDALYTFHGKIFSA